MTQQSKAAAAGTRRHAHLALVPVHHVALHRVQRAKLLDVGVVAADVQRYTAIADLLALRKRKPKAGGAS